MLVEDLQLDLHESSFLHAQFGSGSGREIYNPVAVARPPVVDEDFNRFVVVEIGHQNLGAKWQGAVGGGHLLLTETLTTGGSAASEPVGINGGQPVHGRRLPDILPDFPGLLRKLGLSGSGPGFFDV